MPDINKTIQLAMQYHRAGELRRAELHYNQVLEMAPNQPDVLEALGMIANQRSDHDRATELIGRAISILPNNPNYHCNLALVLEAAHKPEAAITSFQRALQINGNDWRAHYRLGLLQLKQGQHAEAVQALRHCVRLNQDLAPAHFNLGIALRQQGDDDGAIGCFQLALGLQPDAAESHVHLGEIFHQRGSLAVAERHLWQALALEPSHTRACAELECILQKQGRSQEVMYLSHCRTGHQFRSDGNLEQAAINYQMALQVAPDLPVAHYNLGLVRRSQGHLDQAVNHYRKALESSQFAGSQVHDIARAKILFCLGNALYAKEDLNGASDAFEKALRLDPRFEQSHSNLLFAYNYSPDLSLHEIYTRHREFDTRWAKPIAHEIQRHRNQRDPHRRIRVGYVSADFREHAVAYFLAPALMHHDHGQFEFYAYYALPGSDAITEEFRKSFEVWRDIANISDVEAAQRIREDQIDILVDLGGHTADNRLGIFNRKPAPVQVAWLGYPNTTGLSTMDYRITDVWADPEGETENYFSESLARLPETFSCYLPIGETPPVSPLPAAKKGYITFGSFSNFAKINLAVVELWAEILKAIPDSRLILNYFAPEKSDLDSRIRDADTPAEIPVVRLRCIACQKAIEEAFRHSGLMPGRVQVDSTCVTSMAHLERYHEVDIGLDPFPYNGSTTTLQALWMGVPVITLAGRSHISRVGVSQMNNLGYPEWVASCNDDYIMIARDLASDLGKLGQVRAGLRQRLQGSPLMDGVRFTRHLEAAYKTMWQSWCNTKSNLLEN